MIKKTLVGVFAVGLLGMAQPPAHADVLFDGDIEKTATVTDLVLPDNQTFLVTYTADVFAVISGDESDLIDECIDVTDTNVGPRGAVCDTNITFDYILSFGELGSGADMEGVPDINSHANVASFIALDTGANGSDSWTGRFAIGNAAAALEVTALALLGIVLVGLGFSRRKRSRTTSQNRRLQHHGHERGGVRPDDSINDRRMSWMM